MAAARPWRRGTEAMAHAHVVGESGSGGRVIQNKPFSRVRRPLSKNPNVSRHCEISQCSCRIVARTRGTRELVRQKLPIYRKAVLPLRGGAGRVDTRSKEHLLLSV